MITLFDAAIFDFDGTLVDSLDVWKKIDYSFLEEKRKIKVPDDYIHAIAAMSFFEIAQYTKERFNLPDTPKQLMDEWTDMAIREYSNNIKLKPFVFQYIEKLKKMGKRIVLCTSSPAYFYEPALKNNGIYNMFDAFADTTEAGEGKNTQRVFLLAAKKARTSPNKCIVFEDVMSAALSAKKAGMLVCGVYDKCTGVFKEDMQAFCDFYINGFDEIL